MVFIKDYYIYEINRDEVIFPAFLKNIKKCPKKIWAIGDIKLLNKKAIAIVGSRNSSLYGCQMAESITKDLVKNDIVIVSGMAVGIDYVAHNTCINNGGKTIAVLASGFNNVYPSENIELFNRIIESGGLVISEYDKDVQVDFKNFPLRNRIISGLAMGVVVVEATYRSGTSITARYAKEQGKPVFCVPNCVGGKNSYGIISLLKNGASLVCNGNDVLKELNIECKILKKKFNQMKFFDNNTKLVIDCLTQFDEIDCDEISDKTGLKIELVNEIIVELEVDEIIESIGFSGYRLNQEFYEELVKKNNSEG